MPLYEFECGDCGKSFELLVRSTRWQGSECPHCGSQKLTKKFSTFAAQGGQADTSVPATCPTTGRACGCVGAHRH
ncbi:MAG: zinc ribbon domain-containing protein [Verrucomicrobiae bacterium]|nr:zinc ribbon domain-containing protein [Verrucomicrobiae bacterium]MDW8343878.1 zinc ribbon domain-containing protein [Verrucomicrobiae bacterium]